MRLKKTTIHTIDTPKLEKRSTLANFETSLFNPFSYAPINWTSLLTPAHRPLSIGLHYLTPALTLLIGLHYLTPAHMPILIGFFVF